MRKGILGSIPALLAGAGLGLAQSASAPQSAATLLAEPASLRTAARQDLESTVARQELQPTTAGQDFELTTARQVREVPRPIYRGQYAYDNAFDNGPPEPIHDNAFLPESPPCCDTHPCVWANAEYLFWVTNNYKLPPLLTTSTSGTAGILGAPGTQIAYGNSNIAPSERHGARLAVGIWLEKYLCLPVGLELSGFTLGQRGYTYQAVSTGANVLARPIINAQTGNETVYFVSFPGQFSGGFDATSNSAIYNADLAVIYQPGHYRDFPDFLVGFRYMNMNQDITITQNSTLLANGLAGFPPGQIVGQGSTLTLQDAFRTSNSFYGVVFGTRAQYSRDRFFAQTYFKLGVGTTQQTSQITGSSTLVNATTNATVPGGLLALSSNIAHSTRYDFSMIPEAGINFGFQINKCMDIHAGYTFLYWSKVQQASQLIDRRVNPALLPTSIQFGSGVGPGLPLQPLHAGSFWAQGLNAGMTIRY